jgi:N-acetylglucosamine malate deacetylase 1
MNKAFKVRELIDKKLNLRNKIRGLSFKAISNIVLLCLSKPAIITHKTAVVFAPHQDDETLGCGGMIALKRKHGISVSIVFITDGRQSHRQEQNIKPSELIKARRKEANEALSILGVASSKIYFLEQLDGSLQGQGKQKRQDLVNEITKILIIQKPEEVYVPHRKDQHLDHEATYQLVLEAVRDSGIETEILQYPVWLFWQSLVHWKLRLNYLLGAQKISIASVQRQKENAIQAYRSQHSILPAEFLKNFLVPYEIFFKA